jgi:hypothetical protein
MWPRTDFLELVGITHPVIQAPMSGFAFTRRGGLQCRRIGIDRLRRRSIGDGT